MIGRDIVSLLENEAKRRPVVAELLARVETLTDEEIDTAQVPMKWFKDGLREARRRRQEALFAQQIAEIAEAAPAEDVRTSANLKRGLTLEYTGPNFWSKTRLGGEMEIQQGDWFFFPEDGEGCWLNQTFFPNPPMQLAQSKRIAEQTRHQYILAYKAKLNNLPGFAEPSHMVDEDGYPKEPFRIYRTPGNYW